MKGKEKKNRDKRKRARREKDPVSSTFPRGSPWSSLRGSGGASRRSPPAPCGGEQGRRGFFPPPRDSFALPQFGKSLHVPKCPELKSRLLPVRSWAGGRGGPGPAALGCPSLPPPLGALWLGVFTLIFLPAACSREGGREPAWGALSQRPGELLQEAPGSKERRGKGDAGGFSLLREAGKGSPPWATAKAPGEERTGPH